VHVLTDISLTSTHELSIPVQNTTRETVHLIETLKENITITKLFKITITTGSTKNSNTTQKEHQEATVSLGGNRRRKKMSDPHTSDTLKTHKQVIHPQVTLPNCNVPT